MKKLLFASVLLGLSLAPSAFAAPATSSATVVIGTVGPGFTITIRTPSGQPIKTLPPGPATFQIHDRSNIHDFHLTGAGVDKSTTVLQSGTFTWHVTLEANKTYTYKCDPHEIIMIGSFKTT